VHLLHRTACTLSPSTVEYFMTIRKLMLGTVAALVLATGPVAAADEIPAAGKGLQAVAMVFAFAYLGSVHHIQLNDSADPPWTEATLSNKNNELYLRRNKDDPCRFDLGFIIGDKDGWIPAEQDPMRKHIASIRFDKLSGEIETQSKFDFGEWRYNLTMLGAPGSVCSTVGNRRVVGKEACYNGLTAYSLTSNNYRQLLRALRFISENVCSSTELPLND
jgi:hypothetical protein